MAAIKRNNEPAAKASDDIASNFVWLLPAIRKGWPILVACVILGAGIAGLYTKTLQPIYEASAMIEFDPDVVRPIAGSEKGGEMTRFWSGLFDNREYYETQYVVMTSDRTLSAVVRDLGLTRDAAFNGQKDPVTMETAVQTLRSKVRVDPVKMSRLVSIKVEDPDPKVARKLCEAVSRAYVAQNLEKSVNATSDAVVWLGGQLDHFKTELETNENALHEFKRSNDLPSSTIDEISKMIRLEMQEYDQALTRTRTRKQEISARHSELSRVSAENPDQIPASELLNNQFLSSLRIAYQNAVRERRELLAEGKGENHPSVKKADEKIAQYKNDLLAEVKNIQGAVERDLAIMQRQEQGEASLYEAAKKKAVELNLKELEFRRLDRTRGQNEKLYGLLIEQMKQADLARMMNVNNVRLLDPPIEPTTPVRPRPSTNVLVGLLSGFILGAAIMLLKEQLDNSVKTPEDVEQRLGVTFLGLLPMFEADEQNVGRRTEVKTTRRSRTVLELAPELIVHERPLGSLAEAARAVRTNLMFMNPDKPFKRLLVTSAAPSEGKTTVACSIAISLAQGGQRVCIIDCDLRRPRLHRIFDRVGDSGIMNVLLGDATLDEVAQPTVVGNLWCIPAGPIPPNPADVLHSDRFRKLIEELGRRFDRVVIDSPPLVAVTDSAIISTLVDGAVFVVRAFATSRNVSKQGLRALLDVEAPIIGAVLNAVDLRKHAYDYYYQYYYRKEGYLQTQAPTPEGDKGKGEGAAPPPN